MKKVQHSPGSVLGELLSRRARDPCYATGEVMGSMTTEPLWYTVEAFNIFLNTNINDPLLFKEAASIEREAVSEVSRIFGGSGRGFVLYGGTESNITALYILREATGGSIVVAPRSAHISIWKACRILGLRLVTTRLNSDYTPDLQDLCRAAREYRERLVAIVLTAGTTDLGIVEDVRGFAEGCCIDAPIHVDAAYGGFIARALEEAGENIPVFDFRVDAVKTITVDTHKLLTPIPGSVLLVRDKALEELAMFPAPYMPGGRQRSLLGTRTGGAAAAIWAALRVLGWEGIKGLAIELMEKARYLSRRAREAGLELVREPMLPIVTIRVPDREKALRILWEKKLYVYPSTIPDAIRVVVGRHHTIERLNDLVNTLRDIARP